MCLQIIYIWYMYEEDLALINNNGLYAIKYVSKLVDSSRGQPEGSLFNSYYTDV